MHFRVTVASLPPVNTEDLNQIVCDSLRTGRRTPAVWRER
jgi:hypothetical protein